MVLIAQATALKSRFPPRPATLFPPQLAEPLHMPPNGFEIASQRRDTLPYDAFATTPWALDGAPPAYITPMPSASRITKVRSIPRLVGSAV